MAFSIVTKGPSEETFSVFHTNASLNATFDAKVAEALGKASKGLFTTVAILNDTATSSELRYHVLVTRSLGRET